MAVLQFELEVTDQGSKARAGTITTDHGQIRDPYFYACGHRWKRKSGISTTIKRGCKAQIILGNTYHLYLRPGLEVLEQAGGLHRFNAGTGQYSPIAVVTRYFHWLPAAR